MNTVLAPSPNQDVGRQVGNELSNIWWEATSASPRDHLEFGAKLLGFSGEVVDYGALPDRLAAPVPQPRAGQGAPSPYPVSGSAITLDIIYVSRGTKSSLVSLGSREVLPPRDSIEEQQLVTRRIETISAASALTLMATWLIGAVRELPPNDRDWMAESVLVLLILPALYGLLFLVFGAFYGKVSGATGRAKRYMDQVYPPSQKRA